MSNVFFKDEWEVAPTDRVANEQHRLEVLEACGQDAWMQKWAWQKAKEDIVWWVNTTCWIFEPRSKTRMPWVTWKYQEETLPVIKQWFGVKDIGCDKSRDMGATWMFLAVIQHEFQFGQDSSWMLMSRNEKLVDEKGNPDCLFWKLDFLRENQPNFMVPPFERFELKLVNKRQRVMVNGASTTGDAGAGGRRTGIFIDEYGRFDPRESNAVNAATVSNTNSRAMCSTYQGVEGAFFEQMQRTDDAFIPIHLPWTLHPEKMVGSVPDSKNRLGFTSPWYRKECKRLVILADIAQELDMDPQGSQSLFFPPPLIDRIMREEIRPPIHQGSLIYNGWNLKDVRFEESRKGDLLLWMGVKPDGKVAQEESFVIGSDISAGTHATPSTISVANRRTREKVARLARADLSTDRFAELAVALCWFFNEAYFVWDSTGGLGGSFGKRVIELGYRNVYFQREEKGLSQKLAPRLMPGFHFTKDTKFQLLQNYVRCLDAQTFQNRDYEAIKECKQYIYLPGARGVGNSRSETTTDSSSARENHGDLVIGDALCCFALGTDKIKERLPEENDPFTVLDNPPPHTFQWMLKQWQDEQNKPNSQWDSSPRTKLGWDSRPKALEGW